MPAFIGGLPPQGGPLISAEVRNNFRALNLRTGKLTPHATVPASTSVSIGGGVIYFADRVAIDFPEALIDLGDEVTGVTPFNNIGFFKDIVIVVRSSLDSETNRYVATAFFLEGPEKASSVAQPDNVLRRSTDIPVAAFVVRHNGLNVGTFRGQIEPINQADILDYRGYLDVGGTTYFSTVVGDREVQEDGYGAVILDGYTGLPVITGKTLGEYVGSVADGYGGFISPIQQAVDAVSAAGGGTVFLRAGEYTPTQTITIPANINLIGEGRSTVIIRTDAYTGPLFRIGDDNVVIADLAIEGPASTLLATDPLIVFTQAAFCTLRNCFINAVVTAVQFENVSTRNICTNNFITNADIGVSISSDSSRNLVASNQFEGNNLDSQDLGTNNLLVNNIGS